jgi:hypothetical protein
VFISGKNVASAATRGARLDSLIRWSGDRRALLAARLAGGGATVHEFDPFEVVPDEVIEGRCCYFHAGPVCKGDCHSTSLDKLFSIHLVDARQASQASQTAGKNRKNQEAWLLSLEYSGTELKIA